MLALLTAPGAARAYLDIEERGPALRAGDFNLRVTNAGVVGNPFIERSFDPSFEFPKGSGQEFLRYAGLWVGGLGPDGTPHVSGGPMLEWRPTPAASDTVREAWHGRPGSARLVDDDGDGHVDEETLNDRDDDHDGEVDEDLGMIGQQMLVADYVDDRPEAVGFQYASYERHTPLGLSVHQEAYAWSSPGHRGIAGLSYVIRNHTHEPIRDVYVGLFVDWDVRRTGDPSADPVDEISRGAIRASIPKGTVVVSVEGQTGARACVRTIQRVLPMVRDRRTDTRSPMAGVLPLGHTIDPIGNLYPPASRAPGRETFRVVPMSSERSADLGGVPRNDAERYAALAGQWNASPDDFRGDQAMLVSCGPFPTVLPGDSIRFELALVVGASQDSVRAGMGRAAVVYEGVELNRLPDDPSIDYRNGVSGMTGHEACVEPPPGWSFVANPDCSRKFSPEIVPEMKLYVPGTCIWTDGDCDLCTGILGRETVIRWRDPATMPPPPSFRVTAGDHRVRVEWDNLPEILLNAGQAGPTGGRFLGYRVYRLSDWRDRRSLLPPEDLWGLVSAYGSDQKGGMIPLAQITDSTLDYQRIRYEQAHYPVGRYAMEDPEADNGFDYLYAVTTVVETQSTVDGYVLTHQLESPLMSDFWQKVTPQATAREDADGVWVVPNPYRAQADWERPSVNGDRHTRHVDFMGLPRARCTIRIYTVAGDQVATIDHDGAQGDGQASWNLISRNGQDIVSGIYVFKVESSLGEHSGRFVVIR